MDIHYFKNKLEEEKRSLEDELKKIARPNPQDPQDWQTAPENLNVMPSDPSELADTFEESENKEATEKELEKRLNIVKSALKKIENNTYGICEVCGNKIEEKRLLADPAATTCIKHA